MLSTNFLAIDAQGRLELSEQSEGFCNGVMIFSASAGLAHLLIAAQSYFSITQSSAYGACPVCTSDLSIPIILGGTEYPYALCSGISFLTFGAMMYLAKSYLPRFILYENQKKKKMSERT